MLSPAESRYLFPGPVLTALRDWGQCLTELAVSRMAGSLPGAILVC